MENRILHSSLRFIETEVTLVEFVLCKVSENVETKFVGLTLFVVFFDFLEVGLEDGVSVFLFGRTVFFSGLSFPDSELFGIVIVHGVLMLLVQIKG